MVLLSPSVNTKRFKILYHFDGRVALAKTENLSLLLSIKYSFQKC